MIWLANDISINNIVQIPQQIREIILTACDDGDPSATESTRRKPFNFNEISEANKSRHKLLRVNHSSNATCRVPMLLVADPNPIVWGPRSEWGGKEGIRGVPINAIFFFAR